MPPATIMKESTKQSTHGITQRRGSSPTWQSHHSSLPSSEAASGLPVTTHAEPSCWPSHSWHQNCPAIIYLVEPLTLTHVPRGPLALLLPWQDFIFWPCANQFTSSSISLLLKQKWYSLYYQHWWIHTWSPVSRSGLPSSRETWRHWRESSERPKRQKDAEGTDTSLLWRKSERAVTVRLTVEQAQRGSHQYVQTSVGKL